jgi:hypothetical protein
MNQNIKPIAMRCTKEQFDAIRPKLEKAGLQIIVPTFVTHPKYLTNFLNGKKGAVTDLSKERALRETDNLFEEWNEQTFLEYCGIDSFVLPEKWCVEITDQNKHVLLEWVRKQHKYNRTWEYAFRAGNFALSKHPCDNSYLWTGTTKSLKGEDSEYLQITFEQFCKHILNQEPIMTKYKNYIVPATDVLKIRAIACNTWKKRFTEYLNGMDEHNMVAFDDAEIDAMFNAATHPQRPVLVEIFGEPTKAIEWNRIKTGSKVMIKDTNQNCCGINRIDLSKPVDVVFYKTPHLITDDGIFKHGKYLTSYCIFYQDGKYVLFSADINVDYITEVIEY